MSRQRKNRKKGNPARSQQSELPTGQLFEDKKVVKTIHFQESDVLAITQKAKSMGLNFSAYVRMILKQSLDS